MKFNKVRFDSIPLYGTFYVTSEDEPQRAFKMSATGYVVLNDPSVYETNVIGSIIMLKADEVAMLEDAVNYTIVHGKVPSDLLKVLNEYSLNNCCIVHLLRLAHGSGNHLNLILHEVLKDQKLLSQLLIQTNFGNIRSYINISNYINHQTLQLMTAESINAFITFMHDTENFSKTLLNELSSTEVNYLFRHLDEKMATKILHSIIKICPDKITRAIHDTHPSSMTAFEQALIKTVALNEIVDSFAFKKALIDYVLPKYNHEIFIFLLENYNQIDSGFKPLASQYIQNQLTMINSDSTLSVIAKFKGNNEVLDLIVNGNNTLPHQVKRAIEIMMGWKTVNE